MLCTRRTALATLGFAALVHRTALAQSAASPSELVIHKEGTTLYHRPGCPVVRDGQGALALSRGQAHARGLTPHPGCDPANSKAAAPAPAATTAASPPITVYVDGPRYYHRKTCSRLDAASKTVKALPLQAAAKSHWPCPACKPPIFKKNTEPAVPGTNRRRGG